MFLPIKAYKFNTPNGFHGVSAYYQVLMLTPKHEHFPQKKTILPEKPVKN